MNSSWTEYKSSAGQTLFIYNKLTGEHKWPSKYNGSLEETIVNGPPINKKDFCSVGVQTDDYGCENGCSSVFISSCQSVSVMSKSTEVSCTEATSIPTNVIESYQDASSINLDAYKENQSIDIHLHEPVNSESGEQRIIRLEQEVPSMVRVYSEGLSISNERASLERPNKPCQKRPKEYSGEDEKCIEKQLNDYEEGPSVQMNLDSLVCPYCSKSFNCKSRLVAHVRIHTGEKPFACTLCEKRFTRKVNLISHIRQHSGEQPFHCTYCDKKFSHKSSLSYHESTHAIDKAHKCGHCEKRFVRRCDLNMHIKTHLGEKPFECSICQRTFLRKDHLKDHLRTHAGKKPFECSICHKTFGQKGTLSYHIKTHTGEKPFQCSVCTKKFIHRGHLNVHMQMHSSERQFECHICQMKFTRQGRLTFHLKTHGEEKVISK